MHVVMTNEQFIGLLKSNDTLFAAYLDSDFRRTALWRDDDGRVSVFVGRREY